MPSFRRGTLSHVRSVDLSRHSGDEGGAHSPPPPVPPLPPMTLQGPPKRPTVAPAPTAVITTNVTSHAMNGTALTPNTPRGGPSKRARHPSGQIHVLPGGEEVLQSGWLLKKGRKKLQGYARRHFTLSTHGVLSYRLSPTHPVRGSRALKNVSVAASGKYRQITIDGGQSTGLVVGQRSAEDEIWHLKCLSSEEWTMWMTAIRRFIMDPEVRSLRSAVVPVHSPIGSIRAPPGPRASSSLGVLATKLAYGESRTTRLTSVLTEMETTLSEMEKVVSQEEESCPSPRRAQSFGMKGRKERDQPNGKDKDKEKEGIFGMFHRRTSHRDQISPVHSASDIPTISSRATSSPTPSYTASQQSTAHALPHTLASICASLAILRAQHAQLQSILHEVPSVAHSRPDTVHEHTYTLAVDDIPPETVELPAPFISIDGPSGANKRLSIVTTASAATGGTEEGEWFDADDWNGEEIELDNVELEDSESEGEGEEAHTMLETGPPSTIDHEGQETEPDTEETEETEELKESGETEEVEDDTGAEVQVILQAQQEGRRTKLPVPVSGEEVSLWAVLRKNVGKDLSTVSFPVTFNEPLSLLQKLAEDLEYADLLIKAVAASDPVERMCLVAAFAVSTYASSHYRAARKPFNPMLGETFEDIRPSSRFVAEKVSHHPPVMASYAEGEGWTYWATSGGKNKFWGRSLEIIPTGTTHLKIGENHYQWQKPSSFMRNLMAGQKYVEHVGQMTISDAFSDLSCVLDFKDSGFWGSSRNAVSGSVRSSDGAMVATVEGAWHESFSRQLDVDMLSVLWRANQMPQHAEQYYGFTTFAMQLNELLPSNRAFLPPTDSRLRPDQRALEEGRVDEAEVEKLRLEQEQRQRRKEREDLGKSWEPRWFSRVPGPSGLGEEWVYKGGYWETRAKKMWDNPGLW